MNPDNNKSSTSRVLTPSELTEKEKEQKAARTKRQRKYRAKLTPKQKATYNELTKKRYQNMTPEQKAAHNKRRKEYRIEQKLKKNLMLIIKNNSKDILLKEINEITEDALLYYKNLLPQKKEEFSKTLESITQDNLNEAQKKEKILYFSEMIDKDLEITEEELEKQ